MPESENFPAPQSLSQCKRERKREMPLRETKLSRILNRLKNLVLIAIIKKKEKIGYLIKA